MLHDILERFLELSEASGSAQTATAVDCPNIVDLVWLPAQDIIGASTSEKNVIVKNMHYALNLSKTTDVLLQYSTF